MGVWRRVHIGDLRHAKARLGASSRGVAPHAILTVIDGSI